MCVTGLGPTGDYVLITLQENHDAIASCIPRIVDIARMTFATVCRARPVAPAYAAGSNMPWEQPLTQILRFD